MCDATLEDVGTDVLCSPARFGRKAPNNSPISFSVFCSLLGVLEEAVVHNILAEQKGRAFPSNDLSGHTGRF